MDKFQETIVALIATRNSIEKTILCLYSTDGQKLAARSERINDPALLFTLQNYLQIQLCSFLDEWRVFNKFAKTNNSVKETLKIVAPAIDRFDKWPDLHQIRSSLLAHSPRDKNKEIVLPWNAFSKLKTPTTTAETLLLAYCALMALDYVRERYKTEQEKTEQEFLAMDRKIAVQGILTEGDLENQFNEIKTRIANNKKSYRASSASIATVA